MGGVAAGGEGHLPLGYPGRAPLRLRSRRGEKQLATQRAFRGDRAFAGERYRETDSDYIRDKLEVHGRPSLLGLWRRPSQTAEPCRTRGQSQPSRVEQSAGGRVRFVSCPGSQSQAGRERLIGARVLKEIVERLSFLDSVGVGYLTLVRSAGTLSGGEAQRIRLATQIGSSLVGFCTSWTNRP